MSFQALVDTSSQVAATSKRTEKTALLAALLAPLSPDDTVVALGLLSGEPRQGRIGVGWSAISNIDAQPSATPTLKIATIDAAIVALAETTGPGSASRRAEQLHALFSAATASEVDYLKRFFVGEIRQGALEGILADAIAKAHGVPGTLVRRAAMLSGDLRRAAEAVVRDGRRGLEALGLTVLTGVQPMLASTSTDVAEALAATGPASVEWKLDGARIQVHRSGDEVQIFTRNLNDITSRLPAMVSAVRSLPVASVVLDGETLSIGGDERPETFQETMSRFSQDSPDDRGLRPFFFDILHVDGRDLIDLPLHERLAELERVAGQYRIPAETTGDPAVAATVLEQALSSGHEGVMVKGLDGLYQAGRRGKSWRKVKPVHTLDLVVLGAEWGHGRRSGWLSNLHLGARIDDASGTGSDDFLMVGKTFKGLTDELLRWQTAEFPAKVVSESRGTVSLQPHFIVEIALDGAQSSTTYPGGVALRFARVRRYREDKLLSEVDTINAVRKLLKERPRQESEKNDSSQ